jgi:hypothetical protein
MISPTTVSEKTRLLDTLQAQREHVLGILDGLDEDAARRVVAPSGWSVIQLVQHLTRDDERFWFAAVVAGDGAAIEATFAAGDAWQVDPELTLTAALAAYRAEIERSNALLATTELDAALSWWPDGLFGDWRLDDVRHVVLHVITETATHAGHLDLVRELIDGRQWIAE